MGCGIPMVRVVVVVERPYLRGTGMMSAHPEHCTDVQPCLHTAAAICKRDLPSPTPIWNDFDKVISKLVIFIQEVVN